MQVEQTPGHIFKHGSFQSQGNIWNCLKQFIKAAIQSLHQQHRELAVGEETHTQEQRNVGVTKVRHQLTLLLILAGDLLNTNIASIK
jgi:hypothetical protein